MGREILPEFGQQLLFPPALEDWVPDDHPARFVREFVRALDFDELGIEEPSGPRGGIYFARETLLGVWLYGYFERIRSTRALERACLNHVGFIWLTGNRAPDHNTLWRFWRRNRRALKRVFGRSVRVAADAGLVSMALHAVDGTKIKAAASKHGLKSREQLERALVRLDGLVEAAAAEIDASEPRGGSSESRLPESLRSAEALRDSVRSALERLESEKRKQINPDEPDARVMKGNEGLDLSYNAQAATEGQSGVIVAAEVVDSPCDAGQLVDMLDRVDENLGAVAEETVADGGYSSAAEMAKAEARDYSVLMKPQEGPRRAGSEKPLASKNFRFEAATNRVVCPKGGILEPEGHAKWGRRKKHKVQRYRCKNRNCPFRAECTRDPRGRPVDISEHWASEERMRQKLRREDKQLALKRRSPIAERTFAVIKHIGGFRRWLVRGIESVRAQWYMVCTAVNLRILFGHWKEQVLAFG